LTLAERRELGAQAERKGCVDKTPIIVRFWSSAPAVRLDFIMDWPSDLLPLALVSDRTSDGARARPPSTLH
jgi:hypothetical protein